MLKKLTASLNSEFTGSYIKKCISKAIAITKVKNSNFLCSVGFVMLRIIYPVSMSIFSLSHNLVYLLYFCPS